MTTMPSNPTTALPARPPLVDLATWQAARDELLSTRRPTLARATPSPLFAEEGHIICFLRDGDRVFLTYSTTGRGNEPVDATFGLLDMTPYGRGEAWEDNPEGWPEGRSSCWYWRSDVDGNATWGPTSRPVPQWTRPDATPVETLGRHGHHH
jgi:hypothetical protein